MVEVEIIIPNWNGQKWIRDCLISLQKQTFDHYKIIVVDNGSTDDSVKIIETEFPDVRLIKLAENTGFANAINVGLKVVEAKYVCWFNNDAEAEPNFLEELVNGLKTKEGEGFGMAAPCVLFMEDHQLINSVGLFVGPDGVGRDRGFKRPLTAPFETPTEIFGPSGVAALYKNEIFQKVGLLDPDYFIYSEDVDLNYRAQLAGYRCYYVPTARIYHHLSATTKNMKNYIIGYASRNGITTIVKDLPGIVLLKYLPFIILGQFYQLALYAQRGQFLAALQGKFEAVQLIPKTLKQRKAVQKMRVISIKEFERQWKLGRTTPRILIQLRTRLSRFLP